MYTDTPNQIFDDGLAMFQKMLYIDAIALFEKAAQMNFPPAHLMLATIYTSTFYNSKKSEEQRRKVAESISWFKENSDPKGLNYLGMCHQFGLGVEKDQQAALDCFTEAAEGGVPQAHYKLASEYLFRDESKAAILSLQAAADSGHLYSIYKLATFYSEGKHSLPQDPILSAQYLKKSAKNNHQLSKLELGKCYFQAKGVPQNREKSFKIFSSIDHRNLFQHPNLLSVCYFFGEGTTKDPAKANQLLIQSLNWQRKNLQNKNLLESFENIFPAFAFEKPAKPASQELIEDWKILQQILNKVYKGEQITPTELTKSNAIIFSSLDRDFLNIYLRELIHEEALIRIEILEDHLKDEKLSSQSLDTLIAVERDFFLAKTTRVNSICSYFNRYHFPSIETNGSQCSVLVRIPAYAEFVWKFWSTPFIIGHLSWRFTKLLCGSSLFPKEIGMYIGKFFDQILIKRFTRDGFFESTFWEWGRHLGLVSTSWPEAGNKTLQNTNIQKIF